MAFAKTAISLPKDIMKLLDRQSTEWECSRSASIARIIQEWKQTRRLNLAIVPNTLDTVDTADRFPPTEFDTPEAA